MSPSDYFQPFVDWADGFGLLGLALVSATEAAFQPIPPDVLVIPMVIEANSVIGISIIVLVATLSSVFGAFLGYGIGYYGGIPVLERFVSDSNINRLNFLNREIWLCRSFHCCHFSNSLQGPSLDCRCWEDGFTPICYCRNFR